MRVMLNELRFLFPQSLTGHRRSVRSVSFSPSSSMLCSGSISGEVRLWSVPSSTCVGCFQAHRGAAEALAFLDGGSTLLSAGSDHLVRSNCFMLRGQERRIVVVVVETLRFVFLLSCKTAAALVGRTRAFGRRIEK